ncbi:hypothetical protein EPN96_00960 [bacterium]|nr:MAG: hypothetical protein EPN96_00960 [bacterium]
MRTMHKNLAAVTLIAFIAFCFCGCTSKADVNIDRMASSLTKLSAIANRCAKKPDYSWLGDGEFLKQCETYQPGILDEFRGQTLRVSRSGGYAVVLVCDGGGSHALLEDAGCTAPLDINYGAASSKPCGFTINARELCSSSR